MHSYTVIACILLASVAVLADNPPPSYKEEPANYAYSWNVKDDYSSNNYGQEETRAGDKTTGSYYVALPDGRLQKVTYTVDGYGGYQAEVSYEGEAQYPDAPAPAPYKPAPAPYKPAPTPAPYKPETVYRL